MGKTKTEIVAQEERAVGEWVDARTFEDTNEGNAAAHVFAAKAPNRRVIRRPATAKAREATVTGEPDGVTVETDAAATGEEGGEDATKD